MKLSGKYLIPTVAAVAGILACIFFVIYRYDPATYGFYPGCMFHAITGLNCPGCGTLRAMHQLAHGHLMAALHLNPISVLAIPFLGYMLLSELLKQATGKHLPRVFKSPIWSWILAGIIIAFWILRNIPVYPFTLFTP